MATKESFKLLLGSGVGDGTDSVQVLEHHFSLPFYSEIRTAKASSQCHSTTPDPYLDCVLDSIHVLVVCDGSVQILVETLLQVVQTHLQAPHSYIIVLPLADEGCHLFDVLHNSFVSISESNDLCEERHVLLPHQDLLTDPHNVFFYNLTEILLLLHNVTHFPNANICSRGNPIKLLSQNLSSVEALSISLQSNLSLMKPFLCNVNFFLKLLDNCVKPTIDLLKFTSVLFNLLNDNSTIRNADLFNEIFQLGSNSKFILRDGLGNDILGGAGSGDGGSGCFTCLHCKGQPGLLSQQLTVPGL
ncbi:hypothetical protein E2C01_035692 [Portunus trituberculatus]|uniref:Uncharacterized protein n=1 Tax=Portunus trituberculatus TaxID=210409 RepID=A0A5B7F944_PORTR|nr:hypothetical protein [Portunus trituberculatus]